MIARHTATRLLANPIPAMTKRIPPHRLSMAPMPLNIAICWIFSVVSSTVDFKLAVFSIVSSTVDFKLAIFSAISSTVDFELAAVISRASRVILRFARR